MSSKRKTSLGCVSVNVADALACALRFTAANKGYRAGLDLQYAIMACERIRNKEVKERAYVLVDAVSKIVNERFYIDLNDLI